MDSDTCDPEWVAIQALGQGRYSLYFSSVGFPEEFDLQHHIFPTVQAAKRCLDSLLAAPTPELSRNWWWNVLSGNEL
jgi:hypothetical protein